MLKLGKCVHHARSMELAANISALFVDEIDPVEAFTYEECDAVDCFLATDFDLEDVNFAFMFV